MPITLAQVAANPINVAARSYLLYYIMGEGFTFFDENQKVRRELMRIELQQMTVEQKWAMAESNLIYFIACGITYARSHGQTAEDFGAWAG